MYERRPASPRRPSASSLFSEFAGMPECSLELERPSGSERISSALRGICDLTPISGFKCGLAMGNRIVVNLRWFVPGSLGRRRGYLLTVGERATIPHFSWRAIFSLERHLEGSRAEELFQAERDHRVPAGYDRSHKPLQRDDAPGDRARGRRQESGASQRPAAATKVTAGTGIVRREESARSRTSKGLRNAVGMLKTSCFYGTNSTRSSRIRSVHSIRRRRPTEPAFPVLRSSDPGSGRGRSARSRQPPDLPRTVGWEKEFGFCMRMGPPFLPSQESPCWRSEHERIRIQHPRSREAFRAGVCRAPSWPSADLRQGERGRSRSGRRPNAPVWAGTALPPTASRAHRYVTSPEGDALIAWSQSSGEDLSLFEQNRRVRDFANRPDTFRGAGGWSVRPKKYRT